MRTQQPFYDRIAAVLESPSASFWIKDAIRNLTRRDPVDAARDAELLAALFKQRANEITGGY